MWIIVSIFIKSIIITDSWLKVYGVEKKYFIMHQVRICLWMVKYKLTHVRTTQRYSSVMLQNNHTAYLCRWASQPSIFFFHTMTTIQLMFQLLLNDILWGYVTRMHWVRNLGRFPKIRRVWITFCSSGLKCILTSNSSSQVVFQWKSTQVLLR